MKEVQQTYEVVGVWKTGKRFRTGAGMSLRVAQEEFKLYRDDPAGVVRSVRLMRVTTISTAKRVTMKEWKRRR